MRMSARLYICRYRFAAGDVNVYFLFFYYYFSIKKGEGNILFIILYSLYLGPVELKIPSNKYVKLEMTIAC